MANGEEDTVIAGGRQVEGEEGRHQDVNIAVSSPVNLRV